MFLAEITLRRRAPMSRRPLRQPGLIPSSPTLSARSVATFSELRGGRARALHPLRECLLLHPFFPVHYTYYVYTLLMKGWVIYMCYNYVIGTYYVHGCFNICKCRCMIKVYVGVGWHLPPLRGSPSIVVGERERTHALPGEILYPSTFSAASTPSARASVGAPKASPWL